MEEEEEEEDEEDVELEYDNHKNQIVTGKRSTLIFL